EPVDYLAFGPIFPTATKFDTSPVVGLEGLRTARRLTQKPLVAIGGITVENAGGVLAAGADAVAVISGWQAPPDVPARLEEFRRALGGLD
ncbi:MAG TPA: thiamine phosphate synthase, partial [Methylococcaceae bacterium]|nr:thiamine phosphate synthase [Methylococcaceae bacterium]